METIYKAIYKEYYTNNVVWIIDAGEICNICDKKMFRRFLSRDDGVVCIDCFNEVKYNCQKWLNI